MKKAMKTCISLVLVLLLICGLFAGCGQKVTSVADPVTLTIAGSWEDCPAIEAVGREFTTQYPNCTIVYEYVQDYYKSLQKRMAGDNAIDIFFTTNIQEDSDMLPYALDMNSRKDLNLSDTFSGLIENFSFREENATESKLYAIPLGAEMRGLYINKTLLSSLNIAVPTNQETLLAACKTLKEKGYIPFHGNPGDFAQILLYPWICNIIANADDPKAAYAKVEARDEGLSEMFREPYEFLYSLVQNDYYNYKKAQTDLNLFTETTDRDYARYFFNIQKKGDTFEKVDDVGQVAFMPSPMSLQSVINKTKDDYHSNIEYAFVPAPVGKEGGFAYMSPAHGIAANKASTNLDWSVKFLDFLFQPNTNKLFAEKFNIIPNTKEALSYISDLYDIPNDRISHLGQATFSYGFYNLISASLLDVSKANNPKYMQKNSDDSTSLYPLTHYLNNLEESLNEKDNEK